LGTKNRNRSDSEYYRGIIRELQKENRELKKQLRYYTKRENEFENNREELEALATLQANEEEYKSTLIKCLECGKGTKDSFEIMEGKFIHTCIVCGHRHSSGNKDGRQN
jgi:hypothetical protein